jgi:hypothetical protein
VFIWDAILLFSGLPWNALSGIGGVEVAVGLLFRSGSPHLMRLSPPRSARVVAQMTPERLPRLERKQLRLEAATRVSCEHGELNPQANRRHLSLPNHPAARPRASWIDFFSGNGQQMRLPLFCWFPSGNADM